MGAIDRVFRGRKSGERPLAAIIAGLWRNGEQGVRLDASDLATMFQDAAGTLPVYAPGTGQVDPPVGLWLDKSGRGNHAYQATTTSRPTLSARYNLLTGTATLTTQSVTTVETSYVLTFSGTGTVTLSGAASGNYAAGTYTVTCTEGALTLTVSGSVISADLRPANDGVGLPPYQRVIDPNTYDTAGFPMYLRFDGVDDFLQTASIDFSGTSSIFASSAFRKLSDSAVGVVFELSGSSGANSGAFVMVAPASAGRANLQWSSYGTAGSAVRSVATYPAPISLVVTGIGAISADNAILRANGLQIAAQLTDQGTGNYGNYLFYIGRRGGAIYPFNGRIYFILLHGAGTPDTTISRVERFIRQKAKVF